ncbi:MAG: GAF domain-containing protein, partial [Spirochaetia bacterium]|nr:GAF domain-containing protein [Spirochaetia bacterium]
MNPGTSSDQPMQLVQKLLEAVAGELPDTGLEIRRAGEKVASVGIMGSRTSTFRMDDYELVVGRAPEEIAIIDRATVVSAGTLVKTLLPNIVREQGKPGRISMAGLFQSLLRVLKALESKSTYLDYYEKILHLNQRVLMASGELSVVLQIIMDQAKEGTGGEAASLLLVDSRTNEMYFNIVSGDKGHDLREIRIPAGQGIAGSVVTSGTAEIIPDM